MKQLITGVAIAFAIAAVAAIGAPRVYAFSQQTINNVNPDGSPRFVDPDQRMPFGNAGDAQKAADPNGVKSLNLGDTNFGITFSGGNHNGYAPENDPRMGFTPGDNRNNDGGRTFFGGMPDHLGPN